MRIAGGFCMKTRIPGTAASLGRSCWMTWSAESVRSARGLSIRLSEPELAVERGPPPPTVDMKERTFGSWAMIAATARWCSTIEANEASCAPSVDAEICPLSPLGRKSLGT